MKTMKETLKKEKDEELKTQKAPGNTQRENADPKTQKRSEATQGVNSTPYTQRVSREIQGGNPENRETVERGGDVKVN